MRRLLALLVAAPLAACSHDVLWVGESPPVLPKSESRVPLTVGVAFGSFEDTRVQGDAVVERFAAALREAELFQAVMFPIPPGVYPGWELRLAGSDGAFEPNSNFWKAAVAAALIPLASVIYLENDYTLELEALLVHGREVVATYPASAHVRLRYQLWANKLEVDRDALELAVSGATRQILSELSRDAERLRLSLDP